MVVPESVEWEDWTDIGQRTQNFGLTRGTSLRELLYTVMTIVNDILYIWELIWVYFKCSHHKILVFWDDYVKKLENQSTRWTYINTFYVP
jgi:hypothetical protein